METRCSAVMGSVPEFACWMPIPCVSSRPSPRAPSFHSESPARLTAREFSQPTSTAKTSAFSSRCSLPEAAVWTGEKENIMATPYSGLFIRHQMGDTPSSMGTGWSASPDIILAGTTPAPNPGAYVTPTGYQTDYGSTVYLDQANFTYVRALNASSGAITGRIWLYYVPSNLCLWTQNWLSAPIVVGDQSVNYTLISAQALNDIVVTNPPFVLTPPPPAGCGHYCVTAIAENPPLSDPPVSPIPAGSMGKFAQLVQFNLS